MEKKGTKGRVISSGDTVGVPSDGAQDCCALAEDGDGCGDECVA